MRGLIYILSIFFMFGCAKVEIYRKSEESDLREELTAILKKNVTIDNFHWDNGIAFFSFSNGAEIGIEDSSIPVITLGIYGYWVQNGIMTDIPIDSRVVDDLLNRNGSFWGIREGFEDWSFYFDGDDCLVFGKSLFKTNPDVLVRGVNHRGYSVDAPENTLPAFCLSKLKGFHYVEADVRFSSDNIPLLIHDSTVDRTSDGSGQVHKLCFMDLRSLDFGGWKSKDFEGTKIPSLEEFLALCRDIDLFPYLELKTGSRTQVEMVITLVEEYGLKGKVTYISFSSDLLEYVIDCDPTASVGLLTDTISENSIQIALGLMTGNNYVFIDSSDYSDAAINLCMSASIAMEVWTIDSKLVILGLPTYISGVTSNRYHAGRLRGE